MRKVALWSLPLALAVLWVCGGCSSGDGAARSLATVDTLSNGAVHILNPATGMWSADEAWSVDEIVRIGDAAEGATENSFGDIRAVTFDPLGRIWVVEGQANEIRIFDEEGRHVRTIGGDGDGPGEFSYPMGITWDGEGRAWIADGGNAR